MEKVSGCEDKRTYSCGLDSHVDFRRYQELLLCKKFVNKIKEDEPTIAHLYAIQKQILFCMDAAEDAQQFSADIMNAFPDENGTGLWKTMKTFS